MPGAPASFPSAAVLHLTEVDSTNAEAFRLVQRGERGPLWIVADRQTQGRGRSGRTWSSPKGNLYASLLLELGCTPVEALQLSLVAGVAVHDAVGQLVEPRIAAMLRLKWPNDLMIATAKMGGILVETVALGRTLVAVVGCGLNLAHAPDGLDRPAAGLADHGAAPTPGEVHARLASAFDHWRAVWGEGRGADAIRKAWLARGLRPGEAMAVNTGSERVEGVFQDLGPAGELVLRDAAGRPRQFTFGDVSFATSNTDQKGTPRA